MKVQHRVAVVLVTYNRVALLDRAIQALYAQTYPVHKIIVVNNASTDDTANYLAQKNDIVHLQLPKNTGGAGGFHEGIKKACSMDVDFIWVMDDDAVPNNNTLKGLINDAQFLEASGDNWGFLCSKVVSEDNESINVPSISRKRNRSGYLSWSEKAENGLIGVDTATFVSVLMKKEIPFLVGLPVKEMFIWGDDTEYTWRISTLKNCYLSANSTIYHKRISASALSVVTEKEITRLNWYIYYYRNNLYARRKHGSKKDMLVFLISTIKDIKNIFCKSKNNKLLRLKCLLIGVFKGVVFNPQIKNV